MLAHPFDDGTAAVVDRSVDTTAAGLGPDGAAYKALIGRVAADWPRLGVDGPRSDRLAGLTRSSRRASGWTALQPAAALAPTHV